MASYVVLGDAILDEYVYGRATRVSQEAPVPVVLFERREFRLGGAANVANHFATLKLGTRLISPIGNDEAGQMLMQLAANAGALTSGLMKEVRTPHKTRLIANEQQIVRIDAREETRLSPKFREILCSRIEESYDVSAVVVSDYAKGAVSEETFAAVINLSQRNDCPLVVDPKRDLSFYRGASVLTPNLKEVNGSPLKIVRELQLEALVVTLGAQGLTVYLPSDKIVSIPSEAREVYDVTGAGDTITAMLAMARVNGADWVEAARFANRAAGLVVARAGTVAPSRADLLFSKVLTHEELSVQLTTWRQAGRKIVFTNGCFDLLHVGHVQLLTAARSEGDVLVVGIDSNESVRRLKGPGRPKVTASRRAEVLAALEATTAICVFDDLEELIREVAPDVLVKGEDYKNAMIVGREHAKCLVLVPLVPEASTTQLTQ